MICMNEVLEMLTGIMSDNLWAAPLLSLAAGIITSFTPCSLASVPMLLACVGSNLVQSKKGVQTFPCYGGRYGGNLRGVRLCSLSDWTQDA